MEPKDVDVVSELSLKFDPRLNEETEPVGCGGCNVGSGWLAVPAFASLLVSDVDLKLPSLTSPTVSVVEVKSVFVVSGGSFIPGVTNPGITAAVPKV